MTIYQENQEANVEELLESMQERIHFLESIVTSIGYDSKASKKRRFKTRNVPLVMNGLNRALCVETFDPWKENRVRFYHPLLHSPDVKVQQLPFAAPISPFGGIDDSGVSWVPPAGSTIMILFEGGNRKAPFYLGTVWQRTRERGFGIPFREWAIYEGHRGGYFHGPGGGTGDEKQVLPPWNTENYNSLDIDRLEQIQEDPVEQHKITFPNIYGFKTPEKHMIKMVDGDGKCNRRWKRFEMMSGCGNWFIMKDDHMHYGGQWAHPSVADPGGPDVRWCSDGNHPFNFHMPLYTDLVGKPLEKTQCRPGCLQPFTIEDSYVTYLKRPDFSAGDTVARVAAGHRWGTSSTPGDPPDPPHWAYKHQPGSNISFKHKNEGRPYSGPGTPQNNKCSLPQSGIQLLSIAGHTLCMDDSVEDPTGAPRWERSTEPFDFGCKSRFLGNTYLKSATGHAFTMSDMEEPGGMRGWKNFIEMRSGNGSLIQLNDETLPGRKLPECKPEQKRLTPLLQQCGPDYGGPRRGVHIYSTSRHRIRLIDHMNYQCGPARQEGGVAAPNATKGFIQIQSGYGLEMRFNDDFSQKVTQSQWIQIFHPQCVDPDAEDRDNCNSCKSCDCRGPHVMRFQGASKGNPGLVFLRAGGHAVRQTYDQDVVIVGDAECNPSDKFTYVSKKFMTVSEDLNFNYTGEVHVMFAEKQIYLLAGRDCPPKQGDDSTIDEFGNRVTLEQKKCKGPCVYPVVVGRCPVPCPLTNIIHWTDLSLSERVFASAHHECQDPPDCGTGCASYFAQMAAAEGGKGCVETTTQGGGPDEPEEEPMLPTS